MSAVKRMKEKESRHVRLYHWLTDTEAWRDLDCVARCVYLQLARRYGGPDSNNGRIPYSLAEIAEELGISKQTAMRSLDKLQDHGFVAMMKQGAFRLKHRHATEWRLTEFRCDVTGQMPTKDFARWRKSEAGSVRKPHGVSTRNRTGVVVEQVSNSNRPYGSTTTPVTPNDGSTTTPLVVYQGGGGQERTVARLREAAHTSSVQSRVSTALVVTPHLQRMDRGDA
jgi:DNA-binding transcriptional ArsR family regulator